MDRTEIRDGVTRIHHGITFPDMITPQKVKVENNENENSPSIEFTPGDGINTFGHFSSSEETNENLSTTTDNNCFKGMDMHSVDANDV
ncbi:unnamed protein product [Didymodactylos carnosus]|uniref:Uncharacterized protein n=1 Tax=Didymodactylos carnosus TaxID=1234261 RepID=A0A814WXR0_9BILA|nr:unnamed protein product [Didymodactylos carnosus]CAF1524144.1 unnamed protein product [Didymodactylos carnosus]CAF3972617.1 unnamed protein product [Didymodactylos carnosus]CAF4310932.1 unnamed protein product [Didymodactylos carnosus]